MFIQTAHLSSTDGYGVLALKSSPRWQIIGYLKSLAVVALQLDDVWLSQVIMERESLR